MDSLGVGFSYEEIQLMCQEVVRLDAERRTLRSKASIDSASGHNNLDVASDGGSINMDAMRKRLRFRNTVSEVSEDEGKLLMDKTKHFSVKIIGGK